MPTEEYDPHSWNAMFARVLAQLGNQDLTSGIYRTEIKETLTEIKALLVLQNGRVQKLERWRDTVTAKVSVIALLVSAAVGFLGWLIPVLLSR